MRSSLEKGGSCARLCRAKTHDVADDLRNLVPALRAGEEPRQSLRRNMGQRGARVCAGAGFLDRRFADIGGEDLERKAQLRVVQKFHQADGDRISLLARGASRHPNPDWILGPSVLHQSGEHPLLQFLEDRWFAEERGDGNQTVLAQRVYFLAVLIEMPAVIFQRSESAEGHAPLDAPRERAVLVMGEIHSGRVPHQPEYLGQFRIPRRLSRLPRLGRGSEIRGRWQPVAARFRPAAGRNPPHRRRWRCAACCRTSRSPFPERK